jgi:hypothetical protein
MRAENINSKDFRFHEPLARGRAIRQNCLACQGGNSAEVKRCQIVECFLWPWRMGPGQPTKSETGERAKKAVSRDDSEKRIARLARGRPEPSKSKRSRISGAVAQE